MIREGAGLLLVLTGFMAALAGEVIEKVDNVGAASDVEIVQEEEKALWLSCTVHIKD